MHRYLFLLGSVCISALAIPGFIKDNPELISRVGTQVADYKEVKKSERAVIAERQQMTQSLPMGRERIYADRTGHFFAEFQFNGRRVNAVVDTGATLVAMNESTARSVGIRVQPSDFIYTVNTANGQAKAARALIGDIRIGRIRINDVEAAVMEDGALDTVLIGMSYLKRLRKFEVQNDRLELTR
ncbi:MAG TPA: TIGR02281 family clan AA aspartic protease [Rhizobiaceae bacterium]|nr:TIGR02281 family clan AA aspartic protease [Rhizobiaceae bacterium]